jgi:hypothetical protein
VFGFGHAFGGAICAWSSHLTVRHSVFHGNIAGQGTAFGLVEGIDGFSNDLELTVSSSLVQDGECGVFIQAPDPSFVVNWGDENFEADPMYDENLHLLPGSPCIDAGDPAYVPQADEIDIDGDPRVLDGDGDGVAVIDIGADEFTPQ